MDAIKATIKKTMPVYRHKYGVRCEWATPECLACVSSKGVAGKALNDPR